jgi:hypothetical protein
MRKKLVYSILILSAVQLFISCNKKSAENSVKGLSSLSGVWSGTITTVPALPSNCTFSPSVWTTRQKWNVDDNGNITINDTIFSGDPPFVKVWLGTINQNHQINVYTTWNRNSSCGSPSLSLNFNDQIILTSNSSQLKGTVDFPLCPSTGCLFKLQYALLKE